MFFRLLFESFRRQKRRKSVAFLAIALGMSIATAMIAVAAGIGDKISQELRSTGANLVITPIEDTLDVNLGGVDLKPASEGAYIAESDLPKLKGIFWGHNIVGFAPFLGEQKTFTKNGKNFQAELIGTYFDQTVRYGKETVTTGVRSVNRWWQVEGDWPQDYEDWPNHAQAAGERRCDADVPRELPCRLEFSLRSSDAAPGVLAGRGLAASAGLHIGDLVTVADRQLRISGILNSGGGEDQAIVAPLHIVQQLLRRPNAVRRVIVSALTKPEDAFGRRDPSKMTPAQRDRWYCSPYANSIAFQISEALPNVRVEQVRQVEQNQGKVLSRVSGLMLLLTLAALLASVLAVSAAMAATILERRQEVGLMKSLGASNISVASLFLTEAGLLALAGGVTGFFAGAALARTIGSNIFGSSIEVHPVVLALILFAALTITFAGSAGAVRKAMQFDPAVVLRGDA
ncbi:MAG TPA: ABC transporter permease [Candidatus Angelobacter sp.]|nr:ABC transporter permease [Candidatus Angelobacter sp.]